MALALLLRAFGNFCVAKRRSNHGLDAVRIAARVQGLLNLAKAVLAGDQVVEGDSPRGCERDCGRPCVGVAKGAGDEQLVPLDHGKRQRQLIGAHPDQDDRPRRPH